jgi:hypothetical protein
VLFLTEHHAMKAYCETGDIAPRILDLVTNGGEWSVSNPGRFTPRERTPGTNWIGGWVGSRAGPDAVVNRKIPSNYRDSNPWSSSPQPSVIPLSYSGSWLDMLHCQISRQVVWYVGKQAGSQSRWIIYSHLAVCNRVESFGTTTKSHLISLQEVNLL